MHLSIGVIRAYLDRQLPELEHQRAERHLAGCPRCQSQLAALSAQAQRVGDHFSALPSASPSLPRRSGAGLEGTAPLAQLQQHITQKEQNRMFKNLFRPRYRPAWAILGVVAILIVALTFPSVRAIANSFLGLFRLQQVTVVQVNPGDLPQQLGSSSTFEALLAEDVQVDELGEVQSAASPEAASQMAAMPVRLPGDLQPEMPLLVQPASRLVFTVDQGRVQAILDEIGRSDIRLPAGLDGASVTLEVPSGVTAMFGDCQQGMQDVMESGYDPDDVSASHPVDLGNCTTLLQMPSPTISAPPGLDVAGIGQAFLQVMGMTPEEAASFASNVDWTTTLVIPIPRYGTHYQDVQVDGVSGTLIQQGPTDYAGEYLLVWVKDGVLYALTGPGTADEALQIGNSLK